MCPTIVFLYISIQLKNQILIEVFACRKRADEFAPTSMSTIRRNLKDMSTTDKAVTEGTETPTSQEEEYDDGTQPNGEEDAESLDTPMSQYNEKKRSMMEDTCDNARKSDEGSDDQKNEDQEDNDKASPRKRIRDTIDSPKSSETTQSSAAGIFSQFGGKGDADDWSEFAEESTKEESQPKKNGDSQEKPKYTFGTTSGFGTKGWAAAHTTAPIPTKVMLAFEGTTIAYA